MRSLILVAVIGHAWALSDGWISTACAAPQEATQASASSDPLVRGVSYVGLSVSDLDRAVAFYRDACDLRPAERKRLSGIEALDTLADRSGVQAESQMLVGDNAQLRLMQFESPSEAALASPPVPVEGPGLMHVCFQVLKERRTYQRALAAGATTIGDPEMAQLNPRRTIYYAYIHDFDGRVVEVEHIDRGNRVVEGAAQDHFRLRHICISTPDIERLLKFYTAFLGSEPRRVGPIEGEVFDMVSGHAGTNITMAWYPIGNFELEVNQYLSHPTELRESPRPVDARGYNMIVFDVSDVERAARLLADSGGSIVTEPSEIDGTRIVFARDPDGNLLGLLDAPDDSEISSAQFQAE